jgi:SAM-dependent methyltransferase
LLQAGASPEPYVRQFLDPHRGSAVILDVGCGRGDTVAWLLENGWNAYGVDIASEYILQGRGYFVDRGHGRDRLRIIQSGAAPFPADAFDVVLSNQVLEHVADIEGLAASIARMTRLGGVGLHIFPSRRRPLEPHMNAPLVHWLPKGRVRARAIRLAIRLGAVAEHFDEYNLDDRAAIFADFSHYETFYRSQRAIARAFAAAGLRCDFVTPARDKVAVRAPQIPVDVSPLRECLHDHGPRRRLSVV